MTAAFVSTAWVAEYLDLHPKTLGRKLPELETAGFPKKDPILRKWLRADVEAWAARRRKISDPKESGNVSAPTDRKVNFDAL